MTRAKKESDPETRAMQTLALLLAPLSEDARARVVRWAHERYYLMHAEHAFRKALTGPTLGASTAGLSSTPPTGGPARTPTSKYGPV